MAAAGAEPGWRAATRIAAPRFDAASLEDWFARVDPTPLIRRGLPMIPPSAWSREALSTLFGLDNPNHCFRVAPHSWTTFHERQITTGFVHFLNHGGRHQRLARAKAFAKAAAACAGKDMAVDAATAVRCLAEENCTDILVELVVDGELVGASIEAKLGHALTKGQLPKARRTIRDRGGDPEQFSLLVVAPDNYPNLPGATEQPLRLAGHVMVGAACAARAIDRCRTRRRRLPPLSANRLASGV